MQERNKLFFRNGSDMFSCQYFAKNYTYLINKILINPYAVFFA